MSKYSTSFKLSVVTAYVEGPVGSKSVGDRFGIDHSTVRKWVDLHAAHGVGGLEKKFACYDASFKLGVLRRMWDDGLSLRQAAALFDIRHAGRIAIWESDYSRGGIEALAPRRKGRRPRMKKPEAPPGTNDPSADATKSREELVAELNYLRMENAYLKKLEALTRQAAPKKRKPLPR
jgi:transposase